jgi:hypothetical protein
MRIALFAIVALTLACGDSSGPKTITLNLTSVDAGALPRSLPSGNGTVQVTGGQLVGSHSGPACNYTIQISGAQASFGSVPSCTVDAGDVITLTLDLGGPPAPSGSHNYRFGP